ncbi:MAG: hypothetical protein QM768_05625 [Agriterribacter sp.]
MKNMAVLRAFEKIRVKMTIIVTEAESYGYCLALRAVRNNPPFNVVSLSLRSIIKLLIVGDADNYRIVTVIRISSGVSDTKPTTGILKHQCIG